MVEILSQCPTNWGMAAIESTQWLKDKMVPYYPLGDYKVIEPVKAFAKAF
jgi:2-oxoglutarate ferredoxin oxidoreductase subunit beta